MNLVRRLGMAGLAWIAAISVAVAQEAKPVMVFAAASLQTALNAIAKDYTATTGKAVTFSFGASSALARQIEQGAPADVFASADREWIAYVEDRKLIVPASRKELLGNALVLVEPTDAPKTTLVIAPGFDLSGALGDGRLATGNPQSVPVGRYAKAALTTLGVWDAIGPRIAGADNVRAALALVARGEARFGIVYATDAKPEPKVRVVATFPSTSHPPIVYPFAVTTASTHPDAQAFLAFLSQPAATKVFEAEGFTILK